MIVENRVQGLRSWVRNWQIKKDTQHKKNIALVPTMGALHQGHLNLIEIARSYASHVVLSLFINPLQFESTADVDAYPQQIESDVEQAKQVGVDILFAPTIAELYGVKEGCRVKAGSRSSGLCGASRPNHFDGVVTVVSVLFNIVQPDIAVFGEKDYQQLQVVRELVEDLHFPVQILSAPLVRDSDGLALSSRNIRLSPEDRYHALFISKTLFQAQKLVDCGEICVSKLREIVISNLEKSGGLSVDYVEIVDVETLEPLEKICDKAQLLVAVYVGSVRLIDNIRLSVRALI